MFRSLHIAATGMVAQETNLDTIANNLANANTTGYKRQDAQFEDLLYQNVRPAGTGPGGGAPAAPRSAPARASSPPRASSRRARSSRRATPSTSRSRATASSPSPAPTARWRTPARATSSSTRRAGCVTTDGLPIEPAITIPPDATTVTIAADGTVSATQPGSTRRAPSGSSSSSRFRTPTGSRPSGTTSSCATGASGEPITGAPGAEGRGTLMQGAIEGLERRRR